MRCLLLALVVGAAGVLGNSLPPLANFVPADTSSQDEPVVPQVNWGLQGAVTEELWEEFTVRWMKDDPPTIVHNNLNGASEPVTLVGKHMKTIKERPIFAFQGIMYGEEMSGDLRFKKTVPKAPYWGNDTELDLGHLGEMCPQKSMIGGVPAGREDCLSLNVYTPYLPDGERLLPVMFFIHGGAFISGDSSLYLPTKLLDHAVILVVIHYRLGNLGFFSLDNDDAPGNAGLWDQITALRWVQDNIEGFGGDKTKVTIFGESAGAASVGYLLLLPEAAGLFRGVIGESGSALEHWSHDPDPITSAEVIAANNGCPTDNHTELYECMRDMDADTLSLSMAHFVGQDRKDGQMGFRGAAPVTQSSNVTERLVVKHPLDYLKDGNFSDVPLIIGTNKHEGSFVLTIMYTEFLKPNHHLEDPEYLQNDMMIDFLNCFGVQDYTNGISEAIQDAFISGLDPRDFNNSAPGYVDAAGVFFLKAGGWQTAKLHAKYGTSGTYYYSFDFESDDTMFRWLFMGVNSLPYRTGVTHSDEMLYIFSFPGKMDGQQVIVKDRMVKMWTNFAIYGNPTPDEESGWKDLGIPKWQPVKVGDHKYMLVQDECTVETEFPNRWHIALQEDGNLPTQPPPDNSDDYSDLKDERDAFMISMIVFIVAFVCASGLAIFFFCKK